MDFKKINAPTTTVTRDLDKLDEATGSIYESVMIISKRANQISVELKQELNRKLEEFANYSDNLEDKLPLGILILSSQKHKGTSQPR